MAGLVTDVASLCVVRAVPGYVSHLVAIVAGLGETPILARFARRIGARAGNVTRLVAVVARRRVGALVAVFSDVTLAVAPVAAVGSLLAVPSIVTKAIALEALLAAATESSVPASAVAIAITVPSAGAAATTAAFTTTTPLGALTCEVAWPVAFIANA